MRINKIILLIIFMLGNFYSCSAQRNTTFILFDFYQQEQKGNILDSNFMEKKFGKGQVTFTRGLETNGYIDEFICTATENSELSLEKCCFEEKKVISAKELKNKKIILVEITPKKDTIAYKAKWQRLYFEE